MVAVPKAVITQVYVQVHLAKTPTRSSGLALATVRAPRSALCSEHAPTNMGSPSLAAALSMEQQSTHSTELLRMWRSAPELCRAKYTPPFPSGDVAICSAHHTCRGLFLPVPNSKHHIACSHYAWRRRPGHDTAEPNKCAGQ